MLRKIKSCLPTFSIFRDFTAADFELRNLAKAENDEENNPSQRLLEETIDPQTITACIGHLDKVIEHFNTDKIDFTKRIPYTGDIGKKPAAVGFIGSIIGALSPIVPTILIAGPAQNYGLPDFLREQWDIGDEGPFLDQPCATLCPQGNATFAETNEKIILDLCAQGLNCTLSVCLSIYNKFCDWMNENVKQDDDTTIGVVISFILSIVLGITAAASTHFIIKKYREHKGNQISHYLNKEEFDLIKNTVEKLNIKNFSVQNLTKIKSALAEYQQKHTKRMEYK